MCLVVALCASLPEPPNAMGVAHPVHATLRKGGPEGRHAGVLALGWAFGVLQIAFFVGLLVLGTRSKLGNRGAMVRVLPGALVYLATWTALVLAYAHARGRWLGFPPATAIMLVGLWPAPLVFVALYMRGFRSLVYGPDEARAFKAIMARQREAAPARKP